MISLLPFSPHTTSLISVRTQHIHMMFHLPFLFTLLFLETAEIYRLWMCIFSTLTSRFFFVSHSLCQSFLSTVPFCLLCTLWALKMVGYSISRFDLIPCAERLLTYNLSLRGIVWSCLMCVHLQFQCQEPSWSRARTYFHLCSNTVWALAPWHRCLCCTTDRACPPIIFSMTTELHSGSHLHPSVMRTKSSSHLEIPALTTGWYKHLTSELCRRTKKCRLTSWHKCHVGTIPIMAQTSKASYPQNLQCAKHKTRAPSSLQPFQLISHSSWESLS